MRSLLLGLLIVLGLGASCSSDSSSSIDAPTSSAVDASLTDLDAAEEVADAASCEVVDANTGLLDAGLKPNGAGCGADAECASGSCFLGMRRAYCSIRCTADCQCTDPPFDGSCNDMKYCRVPNP